MCTNLSEDAQVASYDQKDTCFAATTDRPLTKVPLLRFLMVLTVRPSVQVPWLRRSARAPPKSLSRADAIGLVCMGRRCRWRRQRSPSSAGWYHPRLAALRPRNPS